MSWLNFNDSLNNIKGQISNFASGVLADGVTDDDEEDVSNNNNRIRELEKVVANQVSEIEVLRKQIATFQSKPSLNGSGTVEQPEKRDDWFWDPYGANEEESENKNSADHIADLKKQVQDLENDKKELIVSLEQLDLDCQQTTEKIVNLKDALQTDYNTLQTRHVDLELENKKLLACDAENVRLIQELRHELNKNDLIKQVEELQLLIEDRDIKLREQERSQRNNQEEYKKLALILQGYEEQVRACKKRENESSKQNADLNACVLELKGQLKEKEMLHRRYVDLITESFKKFMDYDLIIEEKDIISHNNQEISEFITIVEVILKLLLDLKWKAETLRKEVDDLTEEKKKILTDKNYEIEKLIDNSEILSQEVITKSQALKHYEAECSELIKNNDLLILELDSYKNNSGLQTISESNEDNLLLLESQLENANKRIRDLELTVSDLENSKQDANLEMQSELEYIKKQLNLTGTELSQSKNEYQELRQKHAEQEVEYLSVKKSYDDCISDRQSLNNTVEKIQSEFENTEYKYSEINMDMESLKEENDTLRAQLESLSKTHKKLEMLKDDFESKTEVMQNEVADLKQQLTAEIERGEQHELQIRNLTEKLQNAKMSETSLKLQNDTIHKELQNVAEARQNLDVKCNQLMSNVTAGETNLRKLQEENVSLKQKYAQLDSVTADNENLERENLKLSASNEELLSKLQVSDESPFLNQIEELTKSNNERLQKLQALETHVDELNKSRNELISLVTAKHQESIQYHNEIQRLNQVLAVETEKNTKLEDQNGFLREKSEVLAENLLREQSTVQRILSEKNSVTSEKESSLSRELERLRGHLLEIEEMYTKELLAAETKNQEMQAKVNEIEQREKDSSTLYTSVNIRTNQQVETLQNQLQLVTNQRDDLRKKISDAEDQIGKQSAALSNLQFVLEQFQKDKEKDVHHETERIRRQISTEKQTQNELRNEISNLKVQLGESKQGLLAASRLNEQLESSRQQLTSMKEEVSKLQQQLAKSEEKYNTLTSHTDAKVDKQLIKNLIVGFVSANPNFTKDQHQVLKLIATVLDFNQQDNDKVNLNKQQGSWLSSILHPQGVGSDQRANEESLSHAFVRFLENESKPRQLPNLLDTANAHTSTDHTKGSETSSRQSPILLSEIVLPTFADFGQNRNSSSILKDVLKNNN